MNEQRKSIARETLDLAKETRQAVLGIPETEDKGMVGDLKEVKADVKDHSKALAHLSALHEPENTHMDTGSISKKKKAGLLGGTGAIIAGAIYAIIQAFRSNPQ